MVIFDQLRISDDGKSLYVNAHINTATAFNGITFKSITILTADKVSETAPECSPGDEFIYHYDFPEGSNLREIAEVITTASFTAAWNNLSEQGGPIDSTKPYATVDFGNDKTLSKDLFFVYLECQSTGQADPCFECLPCSMQEMVTLGVTFDENMLYQKVMGYTKDFLKDCESTGSTKDFTDFILLWNAFKAALETEHYIPAIKFYNMLFGNPSTKASEDGSHSPYGNGSTRVMRNCNCGQS